MEKADHQHKLTARLLPKVGASEKGLTGLFLFFFFLSPETMDLS